MDKKHFKNETFENLALRSETVPQGEFEECRFLHSDLSETDLSGLLFSNCEFISCNFSLSKLRGCAFRDVIIRDSKMLGLRFDHCNPLGLSFQFYNTVLDHSVFYKLKLKKIKFETCSLKEVDFTEADLSQSILRNCDLSGAVFDHTNLENADFRTSHHLQFDPENNRIQNAFFSMSAIGGLLWKYKIRIEA